MMNRVTSLLLVAITTTSLVHALCPVENGKLTFTGDCSEASINLAECDLATELNIGASQIEAACESAMAPFVFSDINDNSWTFDDIYFSGGGPFNNDLETDGDDKTIANSAAHLKNIRKNVVSSQPLGMPEYDALKNYTIISYLADQDFDKFYGEEVVEADFDVAGADEFPPYLSEFNLTSSCDLNTIMCCFTDDRLDTDLEDNSDVCMHDLRDSYRSNHISNGYGVYDSDAPAYCVGYHWDDDETSDSYRYRGNALFDISFGTFLDKKYVKNIPGAPLCGCMEQMPVVSTSSCREVNVTNENTWILTNTGDGISIVKNADVSFAPCAAGDLKTSIAVSASSEVMEELSDHLVDDCTLPKAKYLNQNFLVPDQENTAENFEFRDATQWKQVAGQGLYYYPTKHLNDLDTRDGEFREYLDLSPNKIVYRHCPSCRASHQHIYYKRLTEVPDEINLINVFLNDWRSADNVMGVDFDLFSTYEDALLGDSPWTFCNFASDGNTVGFPRDCGPSQLTACQWNSHLEDVNLCGPRDYSAHNHAFYVEQQAL